MHQGTSTTVDRPPISRQSSIDSSIFSNSTVASSSVTIIKRPESVAQRILRERQEKNLKTRFLTQGSITQHIEQNRRRRRRSSVEQNNAAHNIPTTMPLHIALKQTALKHSSRNQTASQIQQQAHIDTVKSFKVKHIEN